jgi:cytochrome c2
MKTRLATALAALAIAGLAGAAHAEGDAAKGEKVFNKCKACHMVGDNAKNRVGPELNGIVGRAIASAPEFKYSDAFQAKKGEGFVWSEDSLKEYLEDPKKFIPGNKMAFAGLKKEDDRENVVAYLKTFK